MVFALGFPMDGLTFQKRFNVEFVFEVNWRHSLKTCSQSLGEGLQIQDKGRAKG